MTDVIQVFTTAASQEDAQRIAAEAVEARAAACAQVWGPITSTFHWRGKVESDEEWLCALKSQERLYEKLEKVIVEAHPYDVPEILAVPVTAGHAPYLAWLREALSA